MSEEHGSTEMTAELVLEQTEADEAASSKHNWHKLVALSTLVMALLAALGGLLSGITAQESQLERTKEIIDLTILENDRISVDVLKAKHEILITLGESPTEAEIEAIRTYEAEIDEKRKDIFEEETLAQSFGQTHLIFAISVTILAVGITLSGMSVVIDLKWLWFVGMIFGALGIAGVLAGVISMVA